MLIIAISFIFGTMLSVTSYYYTKAFAAAFFASLPVGMIILKLSYPLGDIATTGTDKELGVFGFYGALFDKLSSDMQTAILFFPAFFFVARLITWGYHMVIKDEAVPKPSADRKQRILADYGM